MRGEGVVYRAKDRLRSVETPLPEHQHRRTCRGSAQLLHCVALDHLDRDIHRRLASSLTRCLQLPSFVGETLLDVLARVRPSRPGQRNPHVEAACQT